MVYWLVQLTCSADGVVPVIAADDLGVGDDPTDPGDGPDEPEQESPPTPSSIDQDDVKHCAISDRLTFVERGPRMALLRAEELAHEHVHLERLERPPRS